MSASEYSMSAMPEWYRTERETEKIIEKLRSVKELDYYLRNPDEYIRRLAILRLYKITDKDSLYILKEVLDAPLESDENKYLTAWVLKYLTKKSGTDFYISSKYLNKFTGYESFEELFSIRQSNSSPTVEFDFSSSLSHSTMKLDSDESALERDIFFETEFDFKQWYSTFGSRLLKASIKALLAVPKFIIKLPILLGKVIYSFIKKFSEINASKKLSKTQARNDTMKVKSIKSKRTQRPERLQYNNTSNDYYSLRQELYKKPGVFAFIKKGGFQMLYILFFPLRFALKHKLVIICMLLLTYSLLAFTDYGRAFTNKYMAVDLMDFQKITVQKVKEYSLFAINEFKMFTGINEWQQNKNAEQSNSPNTLKTADISNPAGASGKLYTITAKKGLNIRESPDASSNKVGENSLAFGSTVTYLSKAKKDTAGSTWYYIEAPDGRTGWVSAMFLKEKKEG